MKLIIYQNSNHNANNSIELISDVTKITIDAGIIVVYVDGVKYDSFEQDDVVKLELV